MSRSENIAFLHKLGFEAKPNYLCFAKSDVTVTLNEIATLSLTQLQQLVDLRAYTLGGTEKVKKVYAPQARR